MPLVLLVLPTSTYRASDFLDAARSVGADVAVASEEQQAMASTMGDRFVRIDLCDPHGSAERIATNGATPDAVIGVDEQGVLIAAHAAEMLGLPHNPPRAVAVSRDKALTRITLSDAGLDQPAHRVVSATAEVPAAVASVGLPCVVKATTLSGSRGVIRANDVDGAIAAFERVRAITAQAGEVEAPLLIEGYVPGAEVALEGLLWSGVLETLAVFDKPDPLEGPFFEETIYVTPTRLPDATRWAVSDAVARACKAMGLVDGPVHAEVRLPDGPVVLEVAARSIGGLCSRALTFGAGISLEEVILRHALGLDLGELQRAGQASGVMMIPIPSTGTLRAVDGIEDARAVAGVQGVEITVPLGQQVQELPEGDRYLGFIFAAGERPDGVEAALREAHRCLRVDIG